VPGRCKRAGVEAQIATREDIPQGNRPEPSSCLSQGGAAPISESLRIVWSIYSGFLPPYYMHTHRNNSTQVFTIHMYYSI